MEEKNISYFAFESVMARSERHIKRLIVALVISVVLIFLSNLAWLYAWCQYDYTGTETETTYTQDGEGVNIIGDSNDVTKQDNEN